MQLLRENAPVLKMNDYYLKGNVSIKNDSCSHLDVNDKRSSHASLLMTNRVASGDNVTTGLNSAHRLKEDLPSLVPCCEGKELQINEELVRSGLSAISVKHDGVIQCVSMSRAYERMQPLPGLIKHRNSFRCLHKPDLKRVPYLRRMTSVELESIFRGYSDALPRHTHNNGLTNDKNEIIHTADNTCTKNIQCISVIKETSGTNTNPTEQSERVLDSILQRISAVEDIPAGKRLHGARARLYTSVLAGAKAGQHDTSTTEEIDTMIPDINEDEIPMHEELQIILPPKCEDLEADSPATTENITC